MLIFGMRRKSNIIGHVTKKCSHCGVICSHTQIESKKFFTVFFIPLIPLGTTHYTTCTSCGQRSRDESEAAPVTSVENPPSRACSICGETLQNVDDQCAHCGAPIEK
jgi:ribosomal protein L37E